MEITLAWICPVKLSSAQSCLWLESHFFYQCCAITAHFSRNWRISVFQVQQITGHLWVGVCFHFRYLNVHYGIRVSTLCLLWKQPALVSSGWQYLRKFVTPRDKGRKPSCQKTSNNSTPSFFPHCQEMKLLHHPIPNPPPNLLPNWKF